MFLHTCLYEEWKSIPLNVSCLFTILQIAAATGKSKCLHSNLSSINQNHYCQVLEECHLFQWKRKGQMMLSTWKKERFCWQSIESCASISAFLKVMLSGWCWVEVFFKVLIQPRTRVFLYKSSTFMWKPHTQSVHENVKFLLSSTFMWKPHTYTKYSWKCEILASSLLLE